MGMTLAEARELLASPLWNDVKNHFLAGHEFVVYPSGDLRRLSYLDDDRQRRISLWCDASARLSGWKKVVEGKEVRRLREKFPEVYPEILRYEFYFAKCENDEARLRMVLKLKFPDVLEMVDR